MRFGVFGRRCDAVEMVEDAPDDGGVFDAGDDCRAPYLRMAF